MMDKDYCLTTGQMIDQLKVGEIAEKEGFADNGFTQHVKRTVDGVQWCNPNGELYNEDRYHLNLNGRAISYKWRILPQYVSFEEAIQAFRERKTITYVFENERSVSTSKVDLTQLQFSRFGPLTLRELINGKWLINE